MPGLYKDLLTFSCDTILNGIEICNNIHNHNQLILLIYKLDEILTNKQNVRLIVIDSIASLFRHTFTDYRLRTKLLSNLALKLQEIARKHEIAVVLVNQMTHRFQNNKESKISNDFSQKLIPCLGDRWLTNMTYRIMMYWKGEDRIFELSKGGKMQAFSKFQITSAGIRDLTNQAKRSRASSQELQNNSKKKINF